MIFVYLIYILNNYIINRWAISYLIGYILDFSFTQNILALVKNKITLYLHYN